MSDLIRIGFIGAGGNTRRKHIPGFQALDRVELRGVVNRSRASSEAVAGEFSIPTVYDSWEDLIADPEIDAVCIGTWPYMHCPMTLRALEAGKHVLCEARMAMNAEEARRMNAAAAAHPELVTQIVPSPMMLGPDAAIHQALRDKRLGEIVAVDALGRDRRFVDPEEPMSWRQDIELSGLNTMGLGILYEALTRWVGPARTVSAVTRITVPRRKDAEGRMRDIHIPDHVEVIGELENGAAYHMQVSKATGHGPESGVWIYGTEGTLGIADQKVLFVGRDDPETMEDITPPPDTWTGWRVEEEFIGAIRGTEEIKFTTFADGVRYMEFTEAVAASHGRGTRIRLPLNEA